MKKSVLVLAVSIFTFYTAQAQTLPSTVKNFLKQNYPGWEIGESWVVDSQPRKAIEIGDFDGNGAKDYALLLKKDDRLYAIVLLASKGKFKAHNLLAQKGDERWIAGIDLQKKGQSVEPSIGSSRTIKLKADALYIYDGEGHGTTYYWENGKFVTLAE